METSLTGKALDFGSKQCRFESCVSNINKKKDYVYLVNHINLALSKKLLKTKINSSKSIEKIIYLMYKVGCINNFISIKILKKNKIFKKIVFNTTFYKNTPFYKNIKIITTYSKKFTISLKALKIISSTSRSTILLLSTSKGLMTGSEAIKNSIGGVIICILN